MKKVLITVAAGFIGSHLASTSEVYGDPKVHLQPETYWGNVNPIGPRSVYDEAKRFSEALTMAYYREHKIDIRIVRIFNKMIQLADVLIFISLKKNYTGSQKLD
jgi:nucleoside-diphosphate-sugar epimerase